MKLNKAITIPVGTKLSEAPIEITLYGKWYEHIIEIDKDHTAKLLIDDDALKAWHES